MKKYLLPALLVVYLAGAAQAQVCPITPSGNLANNGDFETPIVDAATGACTNGGATNGSTTLDPAKYATFLANNGFNGDYCFKKTPNSSNKLNPGEWTVINNVSGINDPYLQNPVATAGSPAGGNFMVVDADGVPGKDVWRQNVNVILGTTYFFSVWISNVNSTYENPSQLKFSINNTQLGTTMTASATDRNWHQFYITWVADVNGSVPLRIENIVPTSNGNDLAIDNISFSTSCQYIPNLSSIGQSSLMPPVVSLCNGGGSALLDPQLPSSGYTFKWKKDPAIGTTIATTPTYTATTTGRYYLCYEYVAGCPRTDTVDVVNTFNIELGPNVELCNPASVTFATGVLVPPATVKWYKNTVLIPGETGPNLYVNTSGLYSVEVSAPGCATATDNVTVTNKTVTPTNVNYCPTQNVTLTVSPNNGGQYKWWKDPVSTAPADLVQNVQPGGESYTFSATGTGGYTFYVEDASSFTGSVGPTARFSGEKTYNNAAEKLTFTANQDFKILSMQIPLGFNYIPPAGYSVTMEIEIFTSTGASFSPAKTFMSDPLFIAGGSAAGLYTFTFPSFNISSSWGPNLMMGWKNATNLNGYVMWYEGITAAYPYNSSPGGVVSITGANDGANTTTEYSSFFNWQIQAGTPCARIPVKAIYNCPMPVTWLYARVISSDAGTLLKWATGSETSNSYFIVEGSADGQTFSALPGAQVNGQKNSTTASAYEYLDASAHAFAYYRIKQVDLDGRYSYSRTISLTDAGYTSSLPLIVYPNPGSPEGSVFLRMPYTSDAWQVKIHRINGQQMYSASLQETGQAEIQAGTLSPGVYLVEVNDSSNLYHSTLIIR